MERDREQNIVAWYKKPARKPLIIRGARQVGKSTLVRRAAAKLGVKLWEINLERYASLNDVFGSFNTQQIITELGITSGIEGIGSEPGILFLDEIQATPKALAALRYLYEERPDIAVVSAGSLLEFVLADYAYSMPVGRVEYLWLGPVNFSEFLKAIEAVPLCQAYADWHLGDPCSDNLHTRLLGRFRHFLLCGGMPEAAANFVEHQDVIALREIHRSILETYRDDFGKYTRRSNVEQVRRVFDFIPAGIGKKIRYSTISPHAKAAQVRSAFDLLVHAGIILPIFHSDGTGIPLSSNSDETCVKPLFLDVGLVQTALGIPLLGVEEFMESRFINEGHLAEQLVGQELYFRHPQGAKPFLHYWLRESRSTNAEVDFLIQNGTNILPVEVKAGSAGALRSLHQFMALRKLPVAIRFDLNPPTEQTLTTTIMTSEGKQSVSYRLVSLPLYFAARIEEILRN